MQALYARQSILGLFDDVLVLLPLGLISEPRDNSPITFLASIDWVMMMYSFALGYLNKRPRPWPVNWARFYNRCNLVRLPSHFG